MLGGFKRKNKGAKNTETASAEDLARLAGLRAENYFTAHGLSCSEANLLVMNHGFGGKLPTRTAIDLACGFGGGVGGTGCRCGALSGVIMGLGLYLGPGCKGGLNKKQFRSLVGRFHNDFRESSGSVNCNDLIADFRKGKKGQKSFCSSLTGKCAELAVAILLEKRPELADQANLEFLQTNDSSLKALVDKIMSGWTG